VIPLATCFGTLVLLEENSEDGNHAQSQIGVATIRVWRLPCVLKPSQQAVQIVLHHTVFALFMIVTASKSQNLVE